jgi:magnesium-transporting ATPase (P-type)
VESKAKPGALREPFIGLTASEGRARLEKDGRNAVVDVALHPVRRALNKLWAPVPWMLEAAIILQLGLGDYVEAGVVSLLLLFNAALGFFQEGRAQATLDALKSRLALIALVRRDEQWTTMPAAELVPGDVVKLSLGAVVAADMRLIEGSILIDQSMLTGESLPVEAESGTEVYAGALVRRGEAVALVTATGARTKFGRTAELVRTAIAESSQQKTVLYVVRNLVARFNQFARIKILSDWRRTRSGSRCRSPRSRRLSSWLFSPRSPLPCHRCSLWPRRSAPVRCHDGASCQRVCPRWMKPLGLISCARTRLGP